MSELEAGTYRIVQEALHKAAKHAEASRVSVRTLETENGVEIIVSDDGVGFDVGSPKEGFGLLGMRERVRAWAAVLR